MGLSEGNRNVIMSGAIVIWLAIGLIIVVIRRRRTAFMKAFVFERTGDPNDLLALRELPEPKPGPGEILVRVRLSPVHPSDMHIMRELVESARPRASARFVAPDRRAP